MSAATALIATFLAAFVQNARGTCTQGADTWAAGAVVLSTPLLIAAAFALVMMSKATASWWRTLISLAVVALIVAMQWFNQDVWGNSVRVGTPCGIDYVFYGVSDPMLVRVVVAGYLLMPALVGIIAFGAFITQALKLAAISRAAKGM